MSDLRGKVAIVIGVSNTGNIGQVIAQRFVELGAKVVVAGRTESAVTDAGKIVGADSMRCDVTSEADLEALTHFTVDRHGTLDIAVNAVGLNSVKPFLQVTRADLDAVVAAQVIGPFMFLQSMIRSMQNGGSIIQVSSVTSRSLLPNHAAYMATKAAGDMLVRSAAFDFGHRGIRVNSLSPSATLDAPMAASVMQDPIVRKEIQSRIPLGRIGTTRDVANAAAWLASDDCFMTGENLQVNGGAALAALQPPPTIS